MEQNKKIIKINLAIILAYTIIIQLIGQAQSGQYYKSLFVLMTTMYAIFAHLGINILCTIYFFSKDDADKGKVLALSSLMILVVGFSCCWGSSYIS